MAQGRAVALEQYGGPETLAVREAEEPVVGPDSVLVQVAAASINPVDYKIAQGALDGAFPVLWPLVPGWDVAGTVLGHGPAVRGLEVGQRVFGGVGHLAVQIARARGARVVGTCSARNLDHLRELGAEAVEYGDGLAERVRSVAPDGVEAVLDLVGGPALEASVDVLRSPGRMVSIVDAATVQRLGGTYVFVRPDVAHLRELAGLADSGRLVPHVQSTHPLEDVRAAVEESSAGVRGKVVLTVAQG